MDFKSNTHELFSVQVGTFKKFDKAQRLTFKLFEYDIEGDIIQTDQNEYTVQVGEYSVKEDVDNMIHRLENLGYTGRVCKINA